MSDGRDGAAVTGQSAVHQLVPDDDTSARTNEEPGCDHPEGHGIHPGADQGDQSGRGGPGDARPHSPPRQPDQWLQLLRTVGVHVGEESGETEDRLATVAAWQEAPYFSEAEHAALDLTESVTRLADRPDPVPDKIWDEAALHYDDKLAALVLSIASTNVSNRLNVPTSQLAGAWG
jgi:hypothetical protein